MKEMVKGRCPRDGLSIMNELNFLKVIRSDFIVNMQYAFQDEEKLYLVLDLMHGGDLKYHMERQQFGMQATRFFIACLI